MKLLLSISLFLAAVIDAHAEVLDNFDSCKNFFYKGQIPSGFQGIAKNDLFDRNNFPDGINMNDLASPAHICQTFEGKSRYATLYDRGRRMPLYSAYIMHAVPNQDPTKCKRVAFQLEPELVYRGVEKNMMHTKDAKNKLGNYNREKKIDQSKPKNLPVNLFSTSQAVDDDYKNTGYERGHLNPCGHQTAGTEGYKATFTFTNIVPMEPNLNTKIWSQYEKDMIKTTAQCSRTYVITGVVPANVQIKGSKLTAPTHVWNAYCCVDNNEKPIKSGAVLAENIRGNQNPKFDQYDNIADFQARLKNLLRSFNGIKLFDGDCKPQNRAGGRRDSV